MGAGNIKDGVRFDRVFVINLVVFTCFTINVESLKCIHEIAFCSCIKYFHDPIHGPHRVISDIRYPRYLKSVTCSVIFSFITIFTLCMWFPHIAIDFVFVLDMVILYFFAIRFMWYVIVCNSFSDVAIEIWLFAYSTVCTNFLLFSCMPFFYHYFKFLYNFIEVYIE